jgi:hypothetical protein
MVVIRKGDKMMWWKAFKELMQETWFVRAVQIAWIILGCLIYKGI